MIPTVPYRECTFCVMDTSDPDIEFDAEGRCNHCRGYFERYALRHKRVATANKRLPALIERIKEAGKGLEYDVVIGVSGGVDSCYAAWISQQLGLRLLAVHMDNGWDTALSVRNVKKLVDRLQIGYEAVVLDWEQFKDLQLAFVKASVPEIETPTDIAIVAALHQVAAKHGVKFVIAGSNSWTESILPKTWHYDAKDVRYIKALHRRFGTKPMDALPMFGYQAEAYYKFVKGIRMVYLLDMVPHTSQEATDLLKREMDWLSPGGKHHESTITRFVQSYILPKKFGMDYRRATFSGRICAGSLSREEAKRELVNPPFDPVRADADKHYVAKKFGIAEEELDAIIAEPAKSHNDYPNSQKFLEGVYAVYRRMFSQNGEDESTDDIADHDPGLAPDLAAGLENGTHTNGHAVAHHCEGDAGTAVPAGTPGRASESSVPPGE